MENIARLVKLRDELHEVYVTQVLYSFGLSLISVFVPIYLLAAGLDFKSILMFLAMFYLTMGTVAPLIGKVFSSIGLKHTIVLSIPLHIAYFFFLAYAGFASPVSLLALAALGGFASSLYWNPLNTEFVKNSKRLHRGEEIGHFFAFPKFAAVFAPLIGGYVLEFLGFPPLFILASVVLAVSIIPLFLTKDYRSPFSLRLTFRKAGLDSRIHSIFAMEGVIALTEFVMWPLYIYLFFGDIISVGISTTIVVLAIAVFTILIGKASDNTSRKRIKRIGAIIYAVVWLQRIFTASIYDVFLLSFLGGIAYTLINVSIFSKFTEKAQGNPSKAVIIREIWLTGGRLVLLLLMFLASVTFEGTFALAALASLALLFL